MEWKRLNEVFPNWLVGVGIFTALQALPIPWKENDISYALDAEYFGNVSGEKFISPLVAKICVDGVLSAEGIQKLAASIIAIYGINWEKQWVTMQVEYNPIENYSMVEQMTDDKTVNEYGKTRTRTDDLNQTQVPNLTNTTNNTVHGFNSTSGVPTGEQSQVASGSNTIKNTGTQTDNDGGQDTQTRNYNLKRSGNIGVTTSQQMLVSERELWMWNFFRNVVFPDIDRVLTLQIY